MAIVDFFTKHTKIQNGYSFMINAKNTMLVILLLGRPKITANFYMYTDPTTS